MQMNKIQEENKCSCMRSRCLSLGERHRLKLLKVSGRSSQQVGVLGGSVPRLQSSAYVLPEDSRVAAGMRPAQVAASLHQLPHAVVRRQLPGRDLLQKQQDQHVLLLVKQTEAATHRSIRTFHQFGWEVKAGSAALYYTYYPYIYDCIMFQVLLTHLPEVLENGDISS